MFWNDVTKGIFKVTSLAYMVVLSLPIKIATNIEHCLPDYTY